MRISSKIGILGAVSAATLALAACGPKTQATTDNITTATTNTDDAVTANTAAVAFSPGQAFVNAAAASDSFEIATSTLAAASSQSAAIRKFAAKMIEAHTQSTGALKTAAASASPALTPDATLSAEQQAALDALKAKSGKEFDTAYAAAQVDGHEKTLAKLKDYAATGDVPALKAFAAGLVPTVTAHLNMAKGLKG